MPAARRLGAVLGHVSTGRTAPIPAPAAAAPDEPFAQGWPAGISPPAYTIVPRFPVGDPKVLDYLDGASPRPASDPAHRVRLLMFSLGSNRCEHQSTATRSSPTRCPPPRPPMPSISSGTSWRGESPASPAKPAATHI